MDVQVTLKRAFDGQSLPALVVKILRGRYPPVPTQYSSSLRGLVDSLLKQKPQVLFAGPCKSSCLLEGQQATSAVQVMICLPILCCKAWCWTAMDGCAWPRQLLHATCPLLSVDQKGDARVQARPSVQQLLQLPYVARYVECYAQQMVQLADAQGQGGLQGGLLPFQFAPTRWGPLKCHLELLGDIWRPSLTCSTPLTVPCCQHAPDLQLKTASLMVDVLLDVQSRRSSNK